MINQKNKILPTALLISVSSWSVPALTIIKTPVICVFITWNTVKYILQYQLKLTKHITLKANDEPLLKWSSSHSHSPPILQCSSWSANGDGLFNLHSILHFYFYIYFKCFLLYLFLSFFCLVHVLLFVGIVEQFYLPTLLQIVYRKQGRA